LERPTFLQSSIKLILFWLAAAGTYFIIPSVTPFKISPMPLSELSTFIPFLSWTALIYLSLYPHQLVTFYTIRSQVELSHLFKALLWGVGITSVIYFFFPVIHEIPHTFIGEGSAFDGLVGWIKSIDVSTNLFPSGHVFFTALPSIFAFTVGRRRIGTLLGVWSVLIFFSTLTLRQHGILDAFTGLILAVVLGIIFGWSSLKATQKLAAEPVTPQQ